MKLQFDRGTIVLMDPPKDLDLTTAPGLLWDRRVGAHRAPAIGYPALKRWLRQSRAGFQDIPAPVSPRQELWSDVDLRPYQEAALSAWELGHRRGIVALPTGSGKTRLALAAMHRTRLSALCLVPTRVLFDQWLREIGALYRGPVGCYGDGVRRWAPLTIATFESAYRHMDQLGDRFELVIVDEVHHFGGGLRDETLEMTIADARLGLTATPSRDAGVAARLTELVGATVFEARRRRSRGGLSRQPRFDHAVPGPHRRGTPCVHGPGGTVHQRPCAVPPVSAEWELGGLHLPRGPYPRGPSRPFGVASDATTSRLHRRQAASTRIAAGPAPAFPGADLHG